MPDRTPGGRDQLSQALRELRHAAGLSGKDAAEAAGFYPSKISRIERGHTVPSEDDVRLLSAVYQAGPAERDRLVGMAGDLRAEHRRAVSRRERDIGSLQRRFGRIAEQSGLIRAFAGNMVPGLLQSPAYVKAVFEAGSESETATPESLRAGQVARLEQQRILDDELSPRRFVLLMTEGSLGWAAGPPELMIEQVERILAATYRRNARVGVVPFGRLAPVFTTHGWDLFDQRLVIVGMETATSILTKPAEVAAYVRLTDAIEKVAVYGDEARAVLNGVIERYRALG